MNKAMRQLGELFFNGFKNTFAILIKITVPKVRYNLFNKYNRVLSFFALL